MILSIALLAGLAVAQCHADSVPLTVYGGNVSTIHGSNCYDLTGGIQARCWRTLNVTEYIQTWSSNSVCSAVEGFANCFLRQNGFPAFDCEVIGTGAACPAIEMNVTESDPRVVYVANSIQSKVVHVSQYKC